MNALVTGGGGFLGGVLVRQLLAKGIAVRSYSRGHYPTLAAAGVEQVQGDLADATALHKACAGIEIVFHVAAKAGIWGRWSDYYQANVVGTQNVVRACQTAGIRKLVFTSSPSVTFGGVDQDGVDESEPYPKHYLAAYPHTKALAEQAVLAANGPDLATVALRPHLIWGPGDPHLLPRLMAKGQAGKLRQIGRYPRLVDTTYVDNAAHAHVLAAERLDIASPVAGKAYFISNGEPEPLWDFVNNVFEHTGIPPVTRRIPAWLAYAGGATCELVYRLLRRTSEPPMTRFVAKQLSTAHWFDLSAAERDFHYRPLISTQEGLQRFAESIRAGSPTTTPH